VCACPDWSHRQDQLQVARALLLAADSLVAHGREQWQQGKETREVMSTVDQATKCTERCRGIAQGLATSHTHDLSALPQTQRQSSSAQMQIDGAVETRDKQMLPPQLALTEVHLHCLRCDVEEQANSAPLSSILDQVEGVVSAATLDDIANVCIAAAQQHPSIVCRALKLALGEELNLQMQQEIPSLRSYGKISDIIQRLVTHTQRLPESTASEQTLHFLKKARDIVKRSDSAYPATEVITCHACVHLPTETVLVATDSWRHMTT
jgi:uncharacterized membrane protein YheB (UPF0754 family)